MNNSSLYLGVKHASSSSEGREMLNSIYDAHIGCISHHGTSRTIFLFTLALLPCLDYQDVKHLLLKLLWISLLHQHSLSFHSPDLQWAGHLTQWIPKWSLLERSPREYRLKRQQSHPLLRLLLLFLLQDVLICQGGSFTREKKKCGISSPVSSLSSSLPPWGSPSTFWRWGRVRLHQLGCYLFSVFLWCHDDDLLSTSLQFNS